MSPRPQRGCELLVPADWKIRLPVSDPIHQRSATPISAMSLVTLAPRVHQRVALYRFDNDDRRTYCAWCPQLLRREICLPITTVNQVTLKAAFNRSLKWDKPVNVTLADNKRVSSTPIQTEMGANKANAQGHITGHVETSSKSDPYKIPTMAPKMNTIHARILSSYFLRFLMLLIELRDLYVLLSRVHARLAVCLPATAGSILRSPRAC